METELQNVLAPFFHEIKEVDENVIRAILLFEERPVSVFYFDNSSEIFNDEVSVNSYLDEFYEKYLQADYYHVPGAIQWNYYLVFIADKDFIDKKYEIEQDMAYCRKYVRPLGEISRLLEYHKSETSSDLDLVEKWKRELGNADLDCVWLSETRYQKYVDAILEGNPEKGEEEATKVSGDELKNAKEIQALESISLGHGYRKFPMIRDFEFGKMNLFRGENGTGKTSLLESIELSFCGNTFRNRDERHINPDIKVQFRGQQESEIVAPNDRNRYIARDESWYGTRYVMKQDIIDRFIRFNFFDADAAYRLNGSDSPEEIRQVLQKLILGPEFERFRGRMENFRDRFRETGSNLNSQIKEANNELSEISLKITEIQSQLKNTSVTSLIDGILKLISEIGWNGARINYEESDLDLIDKEILVAEQAISRAERIFRQFAPISQDGLNRAANQISNSLEKLQAQRKIWDEIQLESLDLRQNIQSATEKHELLKRLQIYIQVEAFPLLEDLNSINSLLRERQRINNSFSQISNLATSDWANRNDTLADIHSGFGNSISEITIRIENQRNRVQTMKSTLDKLGAILVEIKSNAHRFLELKPDAKDCPMCGAEYEAEELSHRIKTITTDLENTGIIENLLNQIASEESQLIVSKAALEEVNTLLNIARIFGINEIEEMRPGDAFSKIRPRIELKIESVSANIQRVEATQIAYEERSLSQGELDGLLAKMKAHFPEIEPSELSLVIENLIQEAEGQSQALKAKRSKAEADLIESDARKNILVTELVEQFPDLLDEGVREMSFQKLHQRLARFFEALGERSLIWEEISQVFEIDSQTEVHILRERLEKLKTLISHMHQRFGEIEANSEAIGVFEQTRTRVEEKRSDLQIRLGRCSTAEEKLSDLLKEVEGDTFLHDYFEANKADIMEIFVKIHYPNEFDDIDLGTLELRRRGRENEQTFPISRISTGQRSALAISIFLAMNKKLKNGPNVILFDDPVTFVDDLNVLSFFDYLRQIVINEDRQIFFATANDKIANLFEHKFDFLGEEFTRYRLERNPIPV